MTGNRIAKIVIVGGGTAGWMCAALLSRVIRHGVRIELVESDEIGTIGVGEATIPPIKHFNQALELSEDEFVRETQGSFKLGIEFVDWGRIGRSYIHGFGRIGRDLGLLAFHHFWLRMRAKGMASAIDNYSLNTLAARRGRFMRPRLDLPSSPLHDLDYAFHFDAGLYAKYLRRYAEARGIVRTEGKIVDARLRSEDGFIESVCLESGRRISGDLFVDCSGFRGLLIEQALHTGFESWSHWLPCDRAVAIPCASAGPFLPLTRSTALKAGWQWRIPLQHRIGNGHVYASTWLSDDEAASMLLQRLDGEVLASPRFIRFTPGKRKKLWNKNCVAVGLSGGFLEPLESTSIHLIQTTVVRLVRMLPSRDWSQVDIDEFNRQCDREYERIRNFIILHYKASFRDDSPFWEHCRHMEVPETLRAKMDLFRSHGRLFRDWDDIFADHSWLQVMLGQGVDPADCDPLVDAYPEEQIAGYVKEIESVIAKCVEVMPSHAEFISQHCAAPPSGSVAPDRGRPVPRESRERRSSGV
jgi:tryptophan 7-halogenase